MPFIELIVKMPKYAKFLKDNISNREELDNVLKVVLSEQFSSIVIKGLPIKMRDLGHLTLPYKFRNLKKNKFIGAIQGLI